MNRKLVLTVVTWIGILALLELGVRAYESLRAAERGRSGETPHRVSTFTPHPCLAYADNPDYFDDKATP